MSTYIPRYLGIQQDMPYESSRLFNDTRCYGGNGYILTLVLNTPSSACLGALMSPPIGLEWVSPTRKQS